MDNDDTTKNNAVVADLRAQTGMTVVDLSSTTAALHQSCFATARRAFDILKSNASAARRIGPDEDSAHVTGYHPASVSEGMSRYNAHRRGFVFSDGNMLQVEGVPEFEADMTRLYASLHTIAQEVLTQMEVEWELPVGWFQENLGRTSDNSQWHVKQYVDVEEDEEAWLPMHTDPSLISILVHDAPGKQDHAMGLQYQTPCKEQDEDAPGKKEWLDVPHHGHAVATVLVGSVLSYMTKGSINSCKHRVVTSSSSNSTLPRVAATLFLRPSGKARLVVPPSPLFQDIVLRKKLNFEQWSARVSKNYMKNKETSKPKTQPQAAPSNGYFRDEWTEVSLLSCDPPLTGREKFLGGELGSNGKIYTIPGHASRVLVIDPDVEPPTVKPIGPEFAGEFKWLRGVRMSTGIIYGIPCHADSILKIDPETNTVSTIEWDNDHPGAPAKGLHWKWHGGNIARHDGCLYCIPQFAEYVLKIDPVTETTTFLMGNGPLVGRNKWYGGLVAPKDGCIYGVNQNAKGILRIDPETQSVTVHGDFPEGCYKWHGGVVGPDGCIYGIPAHADTVLKIEPGLEPRLTTIGGPLRTGEHRTDGKYKYLGGAVGHDGNVYFFPSDADYVLQVDPRTNHVREVGPNLRDIESIHHNKWQNGFTAPDGTIYGIPLKSGSILRIRPGDGTNPDITTIGGPYNGLNKWEGGVMSNNGDMFCMPLNHNQVLRMKPIESKPEKPPRRVPQFATLRSSAHTLRYSKSRAKGRSRGPSTSAGLPPQLRTKQIIGYNAQDYDLRGSIADILSRADTVLIGGWKEGTEKKLEAFVVPTVNLQPNRADHPSGNGEKAQETLSAMVANDEPFLAVFDAFLVGFIIPWLKKQLVELGVVESDDVVATFYYQRPPTLRIQPGPSDRYVRPHKDADYGHQDGELNFWMPLTDPSLTETDLWVETLPGQEDYVPLGVDINQVAAFHGSSCKHYVPANASEHTRVSLDFRVGVKGFFDPAWTMLGTKSDHNRREVKL